jgi:membrane-bound ClpP family serine protease
MSIIIGIILLILLGLILFWVEFFLIPGVIITGVCGFACFVAAVAIAFAKMGSVGGLWVLVISIVLFIAFFLWTFRSKTWNKLTLKTEISSQVQDDLNQIITVGDQGIAVSRLAPMGFIDIQGKELEAYSETGYVDRGTTVVVVRCEKDKIIVKPL